MRHHEGHIRLDVPGGKAKTTLCTRGITFRTKFEDVDSIPLKFDGGWHTPQFRDMAEKKTDLI